MRVAILRWWLAAALVAALVTISVAARQAPPAADRAASVGLTPEPTAAATPVPRTGTQLPPAVGTTAYGTLRDPSFEPLPGATAHFGVYEGGVYRIEVPADWNGALVMYAHGYRGEGTDLTVSSSPIRAHLIAGGYAWAASSYRGNGYRPDFGVDDTLALRDLFVRQFGEPRWTVIEGTSMGGHVLVASLEQHPGVYQGALAECGVMTGIGEIDYLAAYTAAAEYLSGVPLLDVPLADFARVVQEEWLTAMGRPGAYTERGRRFDSVVTYLMGGDLPFRAQGLAARYTANIIPRGDPNTAMSPAARAVSTRDLHYRIDPGLGITEQELNAGVRRIDHAPGSRSYEENPVFADVSGRITVPLLSLHTTGDAFVPFSLEQDYRRKTLASGTDGLLVQRAIRRPRHCQFETAELSRAFDDLVLWMERGITPNGDDVLTSDPSALGLRWTTPLLPDDPAARAAAAAGAGR